MLLSEIERFTLIPYDEGSFDCADLVTLVQKEMFGRELVMPSRRPRGVQGQSEIGELSKPYGVRTDSPKDGDLVLMVEFGHNRPGHVGVYFYLAHEAWVLHANEKTGCSILHRARDLPDFGLRVEGYYAWL